VAPLIRIGDDTYAHLHRHARLFEDSPDSVIAKALAALDMMTDEPLARSSAAPANGSILCRAEGHGYERRNKTGNGT